MMTFILQALYTAEMASILYSTGGTPAGSNLCPYAETPPLCTLHICVAGRS